MLSAELSGGIGNIMFQIAAMEELGRRTGLPVCYPNVHEMIDRISKTCPWTTNAHDYLNIFKNFKWDKNLDKFHGYSKVIILPDGYTHIFPEDNTHYVGYFQSEGYFSESRDFILHLFEPADHVVEMASKYDGLIRGNTGAIHVRRGNYLELQHIYKVLDMNYYNRGMRLLKCYGVDNYVVFSNDMQWCRENFKGDAFTFIEDENYVELFVMAKCARHIIANSSFSWWGAYLNDKKDKRVVAPKQWYSSDKYDATHIVPWHWRLMNTKPPKYEK